jgi:hypothetical protein
LQQITLSITPAARKPEQPFGTIIDARVKSSKGVSHQSSIHTEPITAISLWADWISPVNLPSVVERHHVWICDECRLVFMLNLNCSPWKNEAIVLGRPSVLKGWVVRVATKSANSNQIAFEDHPVNFFVCLSHRKPANLELASRRTIQRFVTTHALNVASGRHHAALTSTGKIRLRNFPMVSAISR